MFEKFGNFIFGVIIGGLVGSAAASLLTPKSGEEMRESFRNSIDEIKLNYESGKQKEREDLEAEIRRRWGE